MIRGIRTRMGARTRRNSGADWGELHLFGSLSQVRDIVHDWIISYNEERPHEALGNLPPTVFRKQLTPTSTTKPKARTSTYEMCH